MSEVVTSTAQDDLIRYLFRYVPVTASPEDASKYLTTAMKNHEVAFLVMGLLQEKDAKGYKLAQQQFLYWQHLRDAILQEQQTLLHTCAQRNLKVVNLKGHFLAADVYDHPEQRVFSDIDILVKPEDVGSLLDILATMGYVSLHLNRPLARDMENVIYDVPSYVHPERPLIHQETPLLHHLYLDIAKHVDVFGYQNTIKVEIHLNLFEKSLGYCNTITRQIIDRAILQLYHEGSAWVLEKHDQLLHLLGHIGKHIGDYLSAEKKQYSLFPCLPKLYDIALFIEKYGSSLDWRLLTERAAEWKILAKVAIATRFLDHIFPDRISENFKQAMQQVQLDPQEIDTFRLDLFEEFISAPVDSLIDKLTPPIEISTPITPVHWENLQGEVAAFLSVVQRQDGYLALFAKGKDGRAWYTWQQSLERPEYYPWQPLGSLQVKDALVVAQNLDGSLEVFAKGLDDALWHTKQLRQADPWQEWQTLPGQFADLVSVQPLPDGRLALFAKGKDEHVWYTWQQSPGSAVYHSWRSLGSFQVKDALVAARNLDGSLEVFAKGMDDAIWHIRQTGTFEQWQPTWSTLGGRFRENVHVATLVDGRLEVFAEGRDGILHHLWQETPNGSFYYGTNYGWARFENHIIKDTFTISNTADGSLIVFANTPSRMLYSIQQAEPGKSWQETWQPLGRGVGSTIGVGKQLSGALELFATSSRSGTIWHTWQTTPESAWVS